MRRRILSLILAMAMLLPYQAVTYAQENTATAEVVHMYETLKSLNIMEDPNTDPVILRHIHKIVVGTNGEETTDYGLFREVSKRNFINYVCNMLYDYGFTSTYNEEAIRVAEEQGIIHANQDDLYKPLYYEEAVTMLVRLLAYGDIAEEGGWPYGYLTVASRLGLDKGIVNPTVGKMLTMNDVIRLLYNTLNAPYAQLECITDEGAVYSAESNTTFLYEYRKIYKVEGIVESTRTASISKDVPVDREGMMIGGYTYLADEDFIDMLGMYVEAYVQENSKGKDTVISLDVLEDNTEVIVEMDSIIDISDDGKTFEYYDENVREKSAKLAPSVSIIYNGQPLSKYTKDDFQKVDGRLRFLSNDGNNGDYEVVFVSDYETYVVDYVSSTNYVVKNALTRVNPERVTLDLEEDPDDVIIIVADDGSQIKLEGVQEGDVLRVAASYGDRKVIFAEHTRKTVVGTVESINTEDTMVVTVAGKKYTVSSYFERAKELDDPKAKTINVGGEYTFCIDSAGKIAFVIESANTLRYGMVMATTTSGTLSQKCHAKVFTSYGEFVEYDIADKVEWIPEGKSLGKVSAETIVNKIPTGTTVICYTLNPNNEIKMIKTAAGFTGENIDDFNVKSGVTMMYRPNNMSFESEYYISDGATIFIVNKDNIKDEDSYFIGSVSDLADDTNHTFDVYNLDDFSFGEVFVIEENEELRNGKTIRSDMFVVSQVGKTTDSNGDVTGMISGMIGAYEELSYFCEDDEILDKLAPGTTATIVTDKKGYVNNLPDSSIYYSLKDGEVKEEVWGGNLIHATGTILKGIVEENDVSNMRMKIDTGNATPRILRIPSDTLIIIYNLQNDTLTRGTLGDIEDNAQVVIKYRQSKVMCVVAYQ